MSRDLAELTDRQTDTWTLVAEPTDTAMESEERRIKHKINLLCLLKAARRAARRLAVSEEITVPAKV